MLRKLLRPPGGKPRPPVAIGIPRWHSAPSGVNPRPLLAIRNVEVLHAGAAGAQWPQTFIAARKVGALQTQANCTR